MNKNRRIAVIGLGYVGLPLAAAFGKNQAVLAFDKNSKRITELLAGHDRTGELGADELKKTDLELTYNPADLAKADFYIVAVPTPIDELKQPDLSLLSDASKIVGEVLKLGDIVVYESTVYPGVTEEHCLPILEAVSGLKGGKDFAVGYSPERINPGDKKHRLESITKVVSAQDPETLKIVSAVYSSIIQAGVYEAPDIRTAEAAKVIENTQRDLNIALMNELAIIFGRMGIDTEAVIQAASTKWNFLPFRPGLVGGHCIGVDPYYLTHRAQEFGYHPKVILAGREINDQMGHHIAEQTLKHLKANNCPHNSSTVAILGLTFKENCSDLRNTRVIDIISELESEGVEVLVHSPFADPEVALELYGIQLSTWEEIENLDAMVVAVADEPYKKLDPEALKAKFKGRPIILDVKSILDRALFEEAGFDIWRL